MKNRQLARCHQKKCPSQNYDETGFLIPNPPHLHGKNEIEDKVCLIIASIKVSFPILVYGLGSDLIGKIIPGSLPES